MAEDPLKVSIVVPIYNPGTYFDACMESLLRQSLAPSEYEIVLVDDGSTDDTPAMLDKLAGEHSNIRVFHEPNSGWPGRPRNVGVDNARGEYVQFVDQDDELGYEALQRLYALGKANGSDIVLGKVGGTMQGPSNVFERTRAKCTIDDSRLMESLTPHKMFRREFLLSRKVRFPEGKRRLEDQLFMAAAYLRASVISIVGDYVCYYWLRRDDGGNNSSRYTAPRAYFANLREVLDLVIAETSPGARRDTILRRFFRVEMMTRMREPRILKYPEKYRQESYDVIREMALELFSPGVAAGFAPTMRLRAQLLSDDRLDGLMELARRQNGDVRGTSTVSRAEVRGGKLQVSLTAELLHKDGTPLVVERSGPKYLLEPRYTKDLPGLSGDGWDVGDPLDHTELEFRLFDRKAQTAWFPPTTVKPELVRVDGERFKVVLRATVVIDPRNIGDGLGPGTYEIQIGFQILGHGVGNRPVGRHGPLSLDVDSTGQAASAPFLTRLRPWTSKVLSDPRVRKTGRRVLGALPRGLARRLRGVAAKLR